jgi:hypothetical protein
MLWGLMSKSKEKKNTNFKNLSIFSSLFLLNVLKVSWYNSTDSFSNHGFVNGNFFVEINFLLMKQTSFSINLVERLNLWKTRFKTGTNF